MLENDEVEVRADGLRGGVLQRRCRPGVPRDGDPVAPAMTIASGLFATSSAPGAAAFTVSIGPYLPSGRPHGEAVSLGVDAQVAEGFIRRVELSPSSRWDDQE